MQKLKSIIFDCDGVLINSEIIAGRVEAEVKTEFGFPITLQEQLMKFVGCGMNHPVMIEELRRIPPEVWSAIDERCEAAYRTELKPIDGVIELLETLKVPICVASSSEPESLEKKLSLTGLQNYFVGAVFHGRTVIRQKPEPDLFLHAIQVMKWKASEVLVVEDSVHGVTAGKRAGLTVCGFLGGAHVYSGYAQRLLDAGADYLISDIRNVLRLID